MNDDNDFSCFRKTINFMQLHVVFGESSLRKKNDSSAFDELGRLGEEIDLISAEKNPVPEMPGRETKRKKKTSIEPRIQYATGREKNIPTARLRSR